MSTGVVILGSPRSGTTLVRRIFDAHPSFASPPETYALSAAARFLHADRFAAGLRIGVVDGLAFAGFEESDVLARLRAMVFGYFEEYAARHGKKRWAEKTAFDAFHVAQIRRLCEGHVKFVCMHRHGLDVAVSMKDLVDKTGGFVEELHHYLRHYPEPLEAMSRAWVDTANDIADLGEHEDAITLRYEDLADDPNAQLTRVFEFLGETWEPETLGRALGETGSVGFGDWKTYGRNAIDKSSVGRFASLPSPVQQKLARICNPTLTRLGYERLDIGDDDEIDPEQARRRYQFGLLLNKSKS